MQCTGSRASQQGDNSGDQDAEDADLLCTLSINSQGTFCSEEAGAAGDEPPEACGDCHIDLGPDPVSNPLSTSDYGLTKCEEGHEIIVTMRTPSGALLGEIQSVGTSDVNMQGLDVFEDLPTHITSNSESSQGTESYDDDFEANTDISSFADAREDIAPKGSRASSPLTPRFVAAAHLVNQMQGQSDGFDGVVCVCCVRYGDASGSSSGVSSFVTAGSSIDISDVLLDATVECATKSYENSQL